MRIELIAHVWLIERKKHLRISGRKFSVMIFKDGTDDEDKYAAHEAVAGRMPRQVQGPVTRHTFDRNRGK